MIKCYDQFKTIDVLLTKKELNIFYNLQSLSAHEVSGALIFNKYGRLQKYNVFLGGNDHMTWGHGHIIGYHTHPTKPYVNKYAPPSYIDYVNKIKPTIYIHKHYNTDSVGIVFDNNGTWTFRLTPQFIKLLKNIKDKKSVLNHILKIIKNNTRILNIRLSQPKHIINYKPNKNNFKKINLKQYIKCMKHILTPNKPKTNFGFIITYTPKNNRLIIPNVKQCTEKFSSKTKVYNIPPQKELKLLETKYTKK